MEENRNLEEILTRIEESEKIQQQYSKRQFYMSVVTAVCGIGVLGVVLFAYLNLVPSAQSALQTIGAVAEDLGEISKQLTEADLAGLVEHVDHMAVTSEQGLAQALEKINAINIDELNHAIDALYDVIAPLAKLMSRFGS